jgi:acyl carrier protein
MLDEKQVYPKVAQAFADALGLDLEEISRDAKVIDDLGAESLDFLDIAFRLERAFGIKIPRGEIQRSAEESAGAEFERDGKLTDAGVAALRKALPEVDPEEIQTGFPVRQIPRLFTVATFLRVVMELLEQKERGAA